MDDPNKQRTVATKGVRHMGKAAFVPANGFGPLTDQPRVDGLALSLEADHFNSTSRLRDREVIVTIDIQELMGQAAGLESTGDIARRAGDESTAETCFREALGFASDAAQRAERNLSATGRLAILQVAARLALRCGEAGEARRFIAEALMTDASIKFTEDWMQFCDVTMWPDEWLIAVVRREPPDMPAMDALVERHWKTLFGRCQMLAVNRASAADLAQKTWCRVLRSRHRLNPGGRFAGYLITIATNLWRDSQRSAGRAGAMAEHRLISLNDALPGDENDSITLLDVLPDSRASQEQERRMLASEIDQALEQLTPLLRDVLVARYLTGESCAEIGQRYGRTEQTISGWVRAAIQQMKLQLEKSHPVPREEIYEK